MTSRGEEFTFTWKIENFSCLPHLENEVLRSAEFIVESEKKSKWCLCLYPKGLNNDNGKGRGHISLFLQNVEATSTSPLTILSYTSLETTEGEFQKLKKPTQRTFTGGGKGDFQIISLESLYEKKHLYLPQDVLTVKCCILPDNENEQIPNNTKLTIVPDPFRRQCFSITRIKVQKRSLTWPIKKINKLCEKRTTTSIFSNCAIKHTPSLKLSFSISEDSEEEYAQIETLPTNLPCEGYYLFVKCKMTILTADKMYQSSIEDTHIFSLNPDDKWTFPAFINIKDLREEKYFFVDDTLILQCDFAFSCPGTEYHVEAPQYSPWHLKVNKPSKENQLCGSIRHLYTSGDHCDVSLIANEKTFNAHKCVLCARSAVFKAMFQNDMKEKDTNIVDIADVDPNTLEIFLKFLYSDIVDEELTPEEVSNLYKAADKYQVDLLKKQCSILLLSTLSVSTVSDVIVLADAHKDHFLMTAIDNFLQYHFNETLHSKEWKDFMDSCPKLSDIVMLKALKSKSFL